MMRGSWAFVVALPRLVVVGLLHGYRAVVSPWYGQVCRFYPSCSEYAVIAVGRHGVLRGGALAGWRLLRCNPWNLGGVDLVPAQGGAGTGGCDVASRLAGEARGAECCSDHRVPAAPTDDVSSPRRRAA